MGADAALGADDFWRSAMALHTLRAPGAGGAVPVGGSRAEGILLSAHEIARSQGALPASSHASVERFGTSPTPPGLINAAASPDDAPPAGGAPNPPVIPSPPVITPGDGLKPHTDPSVAPTGLIPDPLAGHIYASKLPKLCCCPTGISIEGGAGDGSYKLSFPWDPNKYRHVPPEQYAPGHTFVATTHFTMKPYKEYKPCILEWNEKIVENTVERVRDQRIDMDHSPTFETWKERMDGNPETVPADPQAPDGRRKVKSPGSPVDVANPYPPGPGSIPAYDIPSHPHPSSEPAMDYKRTIEGEIVVRPGCPDCETQREFWSQFISVTNGIPTRSWLAHSDEAESSPDADNWPKGDEYEKWRAKEKVRLAEVKRSLR